MDKQNKHLLEIGQRIKSARKAKGWSQEKLAEHVNIHATYMSQIETGKVNLTVNILVSISQSLGVPMKDLFQDETTEDDLTKFLNDVKTAYYKTNENERKHYVKSIRGIIYAYTKSKK